MSIERIFYVTPHEMVVYRLQGGAWHQVASFPDGSGSMQPLDEYLATGRELLSCLYTDLIEEEYRNETIPHLNSRDRKALVQRKLGQTFRATPFRAAHAQGRKKRVKKGTGRQDDKILFSALTNPDNLTCWLDKLAAHKVPLIGIYSVPMISRRLLRKLHLESEYTLLFTQHQGTLQRQSFFNNFDLKASRLIPMNDQNHEQQIETLLREVQRNRRYLSRMKLLPHDAQLRVAVLVDAENKDRLHEGCADSAQVIYQFIDINEVMHELGLQGEMVAAHSEELFLHLLHERLSAINYARPSDRRYFHMRQFRKGLLVASLLFALVSAGFSLENMSNTESLIAEQKLLTPKAHQLEQQYQQVKTRLPEIPIEPLDMRAAVDAYSELKKSRFSPRELLRVLSRGLDANPKIQLDKIEWRAADEWKSESVATEPVESLSPDVDETAMDDSSMDEGGHSARFYQVATLEGRLDPVGADYHANFELVENFIRSLRQMNYFIDVTPLKMPLDTDSSVELTGEYQHEKREPRSSFEIRAVIEVGHAET